MSPREGTAPGLGEGAGYSPDVTADELERAVRRLVDKDEIVDLVHRYSYYVDHRLYDQLAGVVTEDCVIDYGPGIGPTLYGREAFRGMFGSDVGTESRPGFLFTSHHNANVLVSFEGDDRASMFSSLYAWHQTYDGVTPRVWGAYHDVVVRTPEGWRFAERRLRVAGNENWAIEWLPPAPLDLPPPGL